MLRSPLSQYDDTVRIQLKQLHDQGKITYEMLDRCMKKSPSWTASFVCSKIKLDSLQTDERNHLISLIDSLTMGVNVDNDSRLRATLDSLEQLYSMSPNIIAQYVGFSSGKILGFQSGKVQLSPEEKYTLAVKTMFLMSVFRFPDYSKLPETNFSIHSEK